MLIPVIVILSIVVGKGVISIFAAVKIALISLSLNPCLIYVLAADERLRRKMGQRMCDEIETSARRACRAKARQAPCR